MIRIQYIITAGGTREPIDEVRFLGNRSTGRLGACIADAAFDRGHSVCFIHGVGCQMPRCSAGIDLAGYTDSSELRKVLERRVRAAPAPSVLVHAAAVADYLPDKAPGKISSDREELVIRLKRNEKIVDFIKTWNPHIQLVKFKLESNRTSEELLAAAVEAGRRSDADWVVANDTRFITETEHQALIVDREGGFTEVQGKEAIARRLVEETERLALARLSDRKVERS